MTSCFDIREELKAYADGELSGALKVRVSRHVEECAVCGRELREIHSLSVSLRELDTAVPPPELRQRILSHIPRAESVVEPVRARVPWWRMPGFALGAAVTALLVFVVVAPRVNRIGSELDSMRDNTGATAVPPVSTENYAKNVRETPATGAALDAPARTTSGKGSPIPEPLGAPSSSPVGETAGSKAGRLADSSAPRPSVPELEQMENRPARAKRDAWFGGSAPVEPSAVRKDSAPAPTLAKSDSETAAPPKSNAPTAPTGPPNVRSGGTAGATPASLDSTADAVSVPKAPNRQIPLQIEASTPQTGVERTETLELRLADVEDAANNILMAIQGEGGRPVSPEKQAQPGADEVVLTLLVPANKLDSVKAMFTEQKNAGQSRIISAAPQSPGQARLRQEPNVKLQAENRMYFGYLAPQDKSVRDAGTVSGLGATLRENVGERQQQEQRGGLAQQDAAKQSRPSFGTRALNYKAVGRGMDSAARGVKKESEELVRLIVKIRTPPKTQPPPKRGKE